VETTTVSQSWITGHLGMNNVESASRVIHRINLSRIEKKVHAKIEVFCLGKNERK
jgi:hypothetical protein